MLPTNFVFSRQFAPSKVHHLAWAGVAGLQHIVVRSHLSPQVVGYERHVEAVMCDSGTSMMGIIWNWTMIVYGIPVVVCFVFGMWVYVFLINNSMKLHVFC